uniref:Protein tyrosine phosphatase receptor type Q n=1 Tax=Poecilia latipinna TaxID=48699 RepID=A0A3B3UF84_9TELE
MILNVKDYEVRNTYALHYFAEITLQIVFLINTKQPLKKPIPKPEWYPSCRTCACTDDSGPGVFLLFPQADVVDVSPGTQYSVTVSADSSSKSSPGVSRMIITNQSVPGPPLTLGGHAVGSNGILLAWTMPSDANNIDGYVIRYKEVCPYPDPTFTQVTKYLDIPETLITDFTSGSTYHIQVAAMSPAGTGPFSKPFQNLCFHAFPAAPGLVTNLTAYAQNYTFVVVTWFLPHRINGLITKFAVKAKHVRTGQTVRVLEVNAEEIMTGALPHCNDAADILSRATPSPLEITASSPITLSAVPPAASWNIPISVGVDQLRPYTAYLFEVSAFTSDGEGQVASTMVRMPESAPEGPPENFSVLNMTSRSISVSWSSPSIITGKFSYVLYLYGPTGCFLYDNSTLDTRFLFTGLTPYTTYRVAVRAKAAGEVGPAAQEVIVTPAEAPSAVQNLEAVAEDSVSIRVSWRSPAQPNGPITQYRLQVLADDTLLQDITLTSGELQVHQVLHILHVSLYFVCMYPHEQQVVDVLSKELSYLVSDLSPFTEYVFRVTASTTAGEGPAADTTEKTSEQVPSSVLEVSYQNISSTSILVNWVPPLNPNGRITHYSVYGLNLRSSQAMKWVTNTTSILISDLDKYTGYKLRVAASTAVGESTLSEEDDVFVFTLEDEPDSPPENLSVVETSPSTASLTWSAPEKANGVIQYYEVFYENDSYFAVMNTTSNRVTLTGLKPFSFYNVSVRAYTRYGNGNQTSETLNLLSGEDGVLKDVQYTQTISYILKSNSSVTIITFSSVTLIHVAKKINKCSFHKYTHGRITRNYTRLCIPSAVPGSPPYGLSYESISPSEVNVSWYAPLHPNGVVTHYSLELWNSTHHLNLTSLTNSLHITHLRKYAQYRIAVQAHTRAGPGNYSSEPLNITTLEDEPFDPPQNVTVVNVTASSVTLMWQPPTEPNGIIVHYTIYYTDNSTVIEKQRSVKVTPSYLFPFAVPSDPVSNLTAQIFSSTIIIVSWDPPSEPNGRPYYILTLQEAGIFPNMSSTGTVAVNKTIKQTTTDNVFLFTRLRKYFQYILTVTPATGAGPAYNQTSTMYLRTDEDIPSSPPLLLSTRNLSSSSIAVVWQRPLEANGEITEYSLTLSGPGGTNTTQVPNTSVILTNLASFTAYNLTIVASTRKGAGPSLLVQLHTDEAGPSSPPRNLTIYNHTAVSVWLTWEPPLEPNGVVIKYGFRIRDLITQTVTHRNSSGSSTTEHLSGFRPHSSYEISVYSYTRVGHGNQFSSPVTFTTNESVSDAVGNLSCSGLSWDSVKLSWEVPANPNGQILFYEITAEVDVQTFTHQAYAPQYKVTGLSPDQEYAFTVAAVNSAGPGDGLNCTAFTLSESVPTAPRFLSISEVTATNVTLWWAVPVSVPGLLKEYHVVAQLISAVCEPNTQGAVLPTPEDTMSLAKYRYYRFKVAAVTNAGPGEYAEWIYAQTLAGNPDAPPRDLKVTPTSTSLRISWKVPAVLSGPTSYLVQVVDGPGVNISIVRVPGELTTVFVTNLTAFNLYAVTVTAFTGSVEDAGSDGKAVGPIVFQTLEEEPKDPPKNVTVSAVPERVNLVRVSFSPPEEPNGNITAYYVFVYEKDQLVKNMSLDKIHGEPNMLFAFVEGLKGGHTYSIQIAARNGAGRSPLSPQVQITTGIKAPSKPAQRPQAVLGQGGVAMVTHRSITIHMPACFYSDDNGPIAKIQVIVAESGVRDSENLTNWRGAYFHRPAPYLTDAGFPNPTYDPSLLRHNHTITETYMIGENDSCMGQNDTDLFCNGPLKPNTVYVFKFRATNTKGQYTDSDFSEYIRTAEEQIILGVLLRRFVSRIHQRKKEGGTYSPREAEIIETKCKLDQLIAVADMELKQEKLNRPVNKKSFLQHVEDLCANDNAKFQEEFSELPKLLPDLATTDADLPWNKSKNRFLNIKPYNNNRVKLLSEPGMAGSDYINASFVSGYLCPNEFIATQGPLPSTVADFWRMIWETGSRTVAMLTQCYEKGRIRCHKYWPEDNKPMTVFSDILISKVSEEVLPDWTVRTLKVEKHGHYNLVKHFNYTSWPEHGVPESCSTLIKFVKAVRAHRHDNSTIVVHCSAGVGRTGVFVALDHLIQHVRDHDFVDIYGLVAELRSERMCMVQNLAQYIFLHQSTLELLNNKGNSQSIWFVNYSALEKMDSLDAMEGDVELEWEETTM